MPSRLTPASRLVRLRPQFSDRIALRATSGTPRPDDDIVECRWFDVKELKQSLLAVRPEHREMLTRIVNLVP